MGKLAEFLARNSVKGVKTPPLVHTTQAYFIEKFQQTNQLQVCECDVFKEKLNYFFVGRPAYKYPPAIEPSEDHEFPCCFIFEYAAATDVKRIFPFDSGGFSKGLFPASMSMMGLEEFETKTPESPGKIIGAYFGTAYNYFNFKAKPDFENEYGLSVLDAELKALHKLATQKPRDLDDRKFAIEVQNGSNLDLTIQRPLAVVAPTPYLEHSEVRNHIENVWHAQAISYPIFSMNQVTAYGNIYEKVLTFYTDNGLI